MFALLGVISSLLVQTMGYKEGPPVVGYPEVCQEMFPILHNVTVGPAPAPFDVNVTCHCYVPGKHIYVNYKVQDGHDPLEGIFIQARRTSGDTDIAVGAFSIDENKAMQTLDCNGNKASAASHNAEVKERNKGSCWKAPSDLGGVKVKFVATTLLHLNEFWTFVDSQELGPCPNGEVPKECLTSTITDAAFCGVAVLRPAGLVTATSFLMVLLTRVIRF